MERDVRLDWQALVTQAIARRKSQKLTQRQLAALAGVSGPTVVRFEQGKNNITLHSALAILYILGLTRRPENPRHTA